MYNHNNTNKATLMQPLWGIHSSSKPYIQGVPLTENSFEDGGNVS
jgi:hypothetical protein